MSDSNRSFSYHYCAMYAHPEEAPEYCDGQFMSQTEIVGPKLEELRALIVSNYPRFSDVSKLVIISLNFLGVVNLPAANDEKGAN